MTTLDQAFVKAFARQNTVPLALPPQPAAPKDGGDKAEKNDECGMMNDESPRIAPVNHQSSIINHQSPISNLQSPIPDPSLSDSLWAALEITAKEPESGMDKAEKNDECGMMNDESPRIAPVNHQSSFINHQSEIPNPSPPPSPDFKPAWQVDHFTWPRLCRRLMARAADELDRLADAILAIGSQGQKVLAIGGCQRGEGATTLLLCAARRLAERGVKPALVDADLGRPRLAKRLGVQPQFGWDETTVTAERPLDEAIVEATGNNLALLPARDPTDENGRLAGDPARLPACLAILREHYDLVLVDLGPLEETMSSDSARNGALANAIDAVILVHGPHVTSQLQRVALEKQLVTAGIAVAGIVENFAVEE